MAFFSLPSTNFESPYSGKRKAFDRSPGENMNDNNDVNEQGVKKFYPKHLVIASLESDALSKLSPFAIEKAIKGIVGDVKSVKKLHSGVILVEVL